MPIQLQRVAVFGSVLHCVAVSTANIRQNFPLKIHGKGWLRLVRSIKLYVSFAKEPYKRDDILQKTPII